MDIKILKAFIDDFGEKADKKFYALKIYKEIKEGTKMEAIKKILQCDVMTINQSIVEAQLVIDKCFNDMWEFTPGTDEYRKAKVEYDLKNQEKWLYYGRLGAVERMLGLISDKEKRDKLEMDVIAYDYYKSVGAEELPF